MSEKPRPSENTDWAASPLRFLAAWGVPIAVLMAADFLPATLAIVAVAGAFAWMGAGCLANAARCRRRHCFLSGPLFLGGAILVALTGFRVLDLGPGAVDKVVWGTLALFVLTFVPEFIWGKYVPPKR
jgi:hypothetical protein